MTQLDWIIVAFAAILAVFGFRRGFIVGVLSFAGFAIGAFLGTRLGPLLLSRGSASPYAPAFGLVGALLAGAILASGLEGLGFRSAPRAGRCPGWACSTGCSARLLGAALALGIVWIVAAVVAQAPGQGAAARRHPALGDPARAEPAAAAVGADPERARAAGSAAVDHRSLAGRRARRRRAIATSPGVRAAARSVVRVLGTACGLAIEGSGWVAAPDHGRHQRARRRRRAATRPSRSAAARRSLPRAGDRVRPERRHRRAARRRARPAAAEPRRRTARRAPPVRSSATRERAVRRAARADRAHADRLTEDAYGQGPVSRLLTPLRGLVRPGNSGGPLVDGDGNGADDGLRRARSAAGRPAATAWPTRPSPAVLRQADGHLREDSQASTGPCVSG